MVIKYVDDAGQTHGQILTPARVLSLVPSLTELHFELGLGDQIVGRTNFCLHPEASINNIPSVGGTKKINFKKVEALNPTHVLVNIDETPKSLAEKLSAMGIEVIVTHPTVASDNCKLFRLLGGLFGAKEKAEQLVNDFENALMGIGNRSDSWGRQNVLYLIWQDPWMTVSPNTYIADILKQAKWFVHAFPDNARYPTININTKILRDIDLVLFSSEPFPFDEKHLEQFRKDFPEHAHKAKLIDAEMVSWYGSRSIEGLIYLSKFAAR